MNAQNAPPTLEGRVAVVESRDAQGKLDRHRVAGIIKDACSELHVDESVVPRIVFVHLTAGEALVGSVPAGVGMMTEESILKVEQRAQPARFIVWLVGRPDDPRIVHAVVDILSKRLGLTISPDDASSAEHRLCVRLASVVSANSLFK